MCKKKAIYTMAELSMQMQTMYNKFNAHCFGGILPRAVISFEQGSKKKAYGWTYMQKMWKQGKEMKYSIVLASEYLDDLNNVMITLVHEMCHIYAMEKGIKDVSRKGSYHNDCFKLIAEQAGLMLVKSDKYGWIDKEMTAEMKSWINDNCPISEIRLSWRKEKQKPKSETKDESGAGESEAGEDEKPKKKSGYYIYVCPKCKAKVRATKLDMMVGCMGTSENKHDPELMMIES